MLRVINFLKKKTPLKLKSLLHRIIYDRRVENFFKSEYEKRVLISYITFPFRKKSLNHTNNYEVFAAAKIFNELGYVVDVIDYQDSCINLKDYDVIYGFGDVFKFYFESGLVGIKTIYYGAGMHVSHQNNASLQRVKDVYKKKNRWLAKSARVVDKAWSHQTSLVDGIIALGNEVCAESYRTFYDGKVLSVPGLFFQTKKGEEMLANRLDRANRSFLWFGSSGLVHKGLDLCLDFFSKNPELDLHICGNLNAELEFVECFRKELYESKNIFVHGFVDINSDLFESVLRSCSFLIFPSCSEGGAPSVLTAVGNGALIPVITKETSVATGYEILIENLTLEALGEAVNAALSLGKEEIFSMQKMNLDYVKKNNNTEVYYENLKKSIMDILNNEM